MGKRHTDSESGICGFPSLTSFSKDFQQMAKFSEHSISFKDRINNYFIRGDMKITYVICFHKHSINVHFLFLHLKSASMSTTWYLNLKVFQISTSI